MILLVCVPAFAFAQEVEFGEDELIGNGMKGGIVEDVDDEDEQVFPFYGSLDIASKNIWRGIGNGDAPLVYPTVGFSKGGWDVFVWGAFAVDDSYKELNFSVSYSFSNFRIELVDYFFPERDSDFFNFSNRSTTHSAEVILYYEPEAVPIHVIIGSTIYGDDKNEKGNNAFSSYGEVGYTHEFNEKNIAEAAVGFSLNKGYYTDYEKGFSPVNLTAAYTRVFTLWNYDLPVSARYAFNPYLEKSYFALSLSFGF